MTILIKYDNIYVENKLIDRRDNRMKKIEIWIGGRKLCETEENNQAIQELERITRKAGYSVITKEENRKIIKMI